MGTPIHAEYGYLRAAGKRIISSLKQQERPDYKDLDALPQIIEFANNQAAKLLVGYFVLATFVILFLFALDWCIQCHELLVDIVMPSFVIGAFCVFAMHFGWQSTGGRDCYALDLAYLLKCRQCRREIQGMKVQEFVDESKCPFCNAKISDVLPNNKPTYARPKFFRD